MAPRRAKMKTEREVAQLCAVKYDKNTDEVYVTFKVVDSNYKNFVLQVARREDIQLTIAGEKMYIVENSQEK